MAPTAAVSSSLQLCVFDSRRGQHEGHELDKILFFYPLDCPLPSQLSIVGLTEGLITFSRIFSPNSPCEFMDGEKHVQIFYECEPYIWMVLIVERDSDTEQLTRDNAYRNLLKEMYTVVRLFYGSITVMLQNNPIADVLRNCLYGFVPDYLGEIFLGKSLWLPTISDSLSEHGTVRILSLDAEVLLEAQSLVGLLESWFGGGTVQHSLILFHNYLISSTLPSADSAALFSYAVLRLTPAAISRSFAQGSKRSYSRHSVFNTVVSSFVSEPKRTSSSIDIPDPSLDGTASLDRSSKASVPRPLQQDAWWQDSDGFLATNAWGVDGRGGGAVIPSVWIQDAEERMQLCIYQHRALTLIMLVPSASGYEAMALLKKQILEKAAHKIQMLEEKLTKQWGGSNSLHVPGYRYLHHDLSRRAVKASPPGKVATLAKDSLAALNKVRGDFDLEKGRFERNCSGSERDYELCMRTKNNAWVAVRSRAGHELYVVLEKASDTLLLASDAIEKFNKRHCEGRFSSD